LPVASSITSPLLYEGKPFVPKNFLISSSLPAKASCLTSSEGHVGSHTPPNNVTGTLTKASPLVFCLTKDLEIKLTNVFSITSATGITEKS